VDFLSKVIRLPTRVMLATPSPQPHLTLRGFETPVCLLPCSSNDFAAFITTILTALL
jgi:hypothetical protein